MSPEIRLDEEDQRPGRPRKQKRRMSGTTIMAAAALLIASVHAGYRAYVIHMFGYPIIHSQLDDYDFSSPADGVRSILSMHSEPAALANIQRDEALNKGKREEVLRTLRFVRTVELPNGDVVLFAIHEEEGVEERELMRCEKHADGRWLSFESTGSYTIPKENEPLRKAAQEFLNPS